MALPGNVTRRTLTGTYEDLAGNPASGTITFKATVPAPSVLIDAGAQVVLMPANISVDLDVAGHFSIDLVVTDDPDLAPLNWFYTATFSLRSTAGAVKNDTLTFQLPTGNLSDIDITAISPVIPAGSVQPVVSSVDGLTGTVQLGTRYVPIDPATGLADTSFLPAGGGGSGTVQSVNTVGPDSGGNITLAPADIGAAAATALASHIADIDPHSAAKYAIMVDGGRHIFTRLADPIASAVEGDVWIKG